MALFIVGILTDYNQKNQIKKHPRISISNYCPVDETSTVALRNPTP